MAARKKVSKQQKNVGITYYYLCLDESLSMSTLGDDVRRLYVQKINDLFDSAEKTEQKVRGSLIKFSNQVQTVVLHSDRGGLVDDNVVNGYRPYGNTKLFDGVQEAIDKSKMLNLGPNDSVLIEVITDGEENSSLVSAATLKQHMRDCVATDKYTFVFQLPIGYKNSFVSNFGIPANNVNEWETTKQGWETTNRVTTQSYGNYMSSRKLGATNTCNFYQPIDVSDVDNSDLKKLDNVTSRFKTFDVDGEIPIKEFVENKANQVYKNGCAFYELSKDELIRPGRELVIAEKNKHTLYGGSKVRSLLGLPTSGNVKVSPYNLGKYRIFAQSSSVNRKLVRGTKVLVDVNQQKTLAPTWGV